jgi:CheY-like chemotaxis protein
MTMEDSATMKTRVLVVDDNQDVANSLVRLLNSMGHEAMACYDGSQAVHEAQDFLPDLMFIDIGMPGLDGYQTVAKIRGHKECAHAILVALSGWTSQEFKQRAYEVGFDLYLAKPMDVDALTEVLKLLEPDADQTSIPTKIFRTAARLQMQDAK